MESLSFGEESLDFEGMENDIPAMKLKAIEDRALLDHFEAIGRDGMDRFILARGRYRLVTINGTLLVNQMRANHELGILETLILAHGYLAAALMTSGLKGKGKTSLDIRCDGPVGGLHVEATASGTVRGYLSQSSIRIDEPLDSFDTAPWFGNGTLSVTRTLDRDLQPYTGRIELLHGNIAQDLTRYYAVSEQTPTALALSVKFGHEGEVIGAGGLLIQSLPIEGMEGFEDEEHETTSARLQELVEGLPSFGELLAAGRAPTELMREYFAELDPTFIGSHGVGFYCDCNRERFKRFIAALPKDDLRDVKENGPFPLRITCHNCSSNYFFDRDEIASLSVG